MHSFELRPNSSLTPRAAVWIYGSLVAVMMGVAVACTALGLWPVLPFAGLEAAVLLGAVAWVQRRTRVREYIRVSDSSVVVEKCLASRRVAYDFKRPWTRIELRRASSAHWPSRLLFSAGGRSVEVGAFLTDSERRGLKERLAEVLAGDGDGRGPAPDRTLDTRLGRN